MYPLWKNEEKYKLEILKKKAASPKEIAA